MAIGRHADSEVTNSLGAYAGPDFDVDENWHVDFGHAGVFQMSIKQIAEAWHAGALIESTLVWHEGLADWEEALAVPQIARAIGAIVAAPGQAVANYQSVDENDDASSDWDATVVETSRSLGVDVQRKHRVATRPTMSPRSLPPPPNVRAAGVSTASSSLPPLPDVKAAFETQEWAHSTPPPVDPLYAPNRSMGEAPRFPPRPFLNETPDVPTTKLPPVIPIASRDHVAPAAPAKPNPASRVPHPSPAPLSVVRVGAASQPTPAISPAANAHSPRLLLWGSIGGALVGAVLLLLWRLIMPSHTAEETSLSSEPVEQASSTGQQAAPVVPPIHDAPATNQEPPKPLAVEPPPVAVEPPPVASVTQPEVPAEKPANAALAEPSRPAAAANLAAPSAPVAPSTASAAVAKPQAQHVSQSAVVDTPPAKPEPTPTLKAKPSPSVIVATVPNDKPVVAPSPSENEKPPVPAKDKAPAASAATPAPPFDKDAAVATLNTAAAAAARCTGDAKGPGTVRVIFSLDGTVHSASIVDGDFEATATGTCVTKAFERCKVPPFSGRPAAVSKRFTVK